MTNRLPEPAADIAPGAPPEGTAEAPLKRLRPRVEQAAHLIEHLRRENERLRTRIEELETHPGLTEVGTTLALDDDPEALRRRIEGYIDAIDRHLADEHAQG